MFFPEKGQAAKANQAIAACFACTVRVQCKRYREATKSEYGIWAGEFTKRGRKKS